MSSHSFETRLNEAPHLSEGETSDIEFSTRFPLRILIAEDNYTNRRLLILMLRGLGYEPLAVENGRECLYAALAGSFDLVLTDLQMPEMSGIECAQGLRNAGLQMPIVAITAGEQELSREACAQVGMNGYLPKPVNFAELKRILKETALRKWVTERNLALTGMATFPHRLVA
jgi:two-component system capsular synthesis sensor histidine kinase RcsC